MKKKIYNVVKVFVFLLLIVLIYMGLKFVVVDDIDSLTRITMHELYSLDENIDTLLIGPSHTFRGIDAAKISENSDRNCFALSTSAQDLAGSYYLLMEADKENDIKDVYLEVSPTAISKEIGDETKTYIITDYMKPSINKYKYLFEVIQPEYYSNAFFTVCRYTDSLNGALSIKNWYHNAVKKDSTYWNYAYRGDDTLNYTGRGHWDSYGNFAEKGAMIKSTSTDIMMNPGVFNEGEISYLNRIVDYCKENQLSLHLYVMPFTDLYVACQPTAYDLFVDFVSDYAQQKNISFMDFNAVSRADLALTNDCFKDFDHLNEVGSAIFTDYMMKVLDGKDDYKIYDSAIERIDSEDRFFGIQYNIEDSDSGKEVMVIPYYNMDNHTFIWEFSLVDKNENLILDTLPYRKEDEKFYFDISSEYNNMKLWVNAIDEYGNSYYSSYITVK
ncbi:MAG: hypothetical protein NC081_01520 [Roseburia sp.]|nr:hypothetical protein [Roseburia sp.]